MTTDATSTVYFNSDSETAAGDSLTVHSGYIAGQLVDAASSNSDVLIKDGSGILTLAGNNSTPGLYSNGAGSVYGGGTIVKEGTLLATNTFGSATGTGPVTVMSGGVLGGTGIIYTTQAIEIQAGGKIDLTAFDPAHEPASHTNTLTLENRTSANISGFIVTASGSITFDAGASFAFDLGANDTSDELKLVSDDITFNANKVDFNFLAGSGAGTYTLFQLTNGQSTSIYTGTLQNGSEDGFDYFFTYNATNITVTLEAVPEPAPWFYVAGSLMLLAVVFARRPRSHITK